MEKKSPWYWKMKRGNYFVHTDKELFVVCKIQIPIRIKRILETEAFWDLQSVNTYYFTKPTFFSQIFPQRPMEK